MIHITYIDWDKHNRNRKRKLNKEFRNFSNMLGRSRQNRNNYVDSQRNAKLFRRTTERKTTERYRDTGQKC